VTQTAKLLYEELVKSALRIMPLNDLEIVLGTYLMEKAKLGDMAKEEEDISQEMNVINYCDKREIYKFWFLTRERNN
jgi:hypothetical protein